jgi:hypothetical protein
VGKATRTCFGNTLGKDQAHQPRGLVAATLAVTQRIPEDRRTY